MQTIACCVDNFKQDDLINAIQTGDQQKQIDNFNDHTTQSSQSLSLSSSSPSSSSSSQVTFTYNLNNYKLLQQNYAIWKQVQPIKAIKKKRKEPAIVCV